MKRKSRSEIRALKDNRYSLQPDSNALNDSDPAFRNRFGSLPRRAAPAPPNRRESLSGSKEVSASKPPLHPSSSPQKTSFKEADLNGSSTFSPASSVTSHMSLGRRYSADMPPGGTLPASLSGSPPRRTVSVSAPGSKSMETVLTNRKRSGSGSSVGGSPRYSRSRSSSNEMVLRPQPILELPKSFSKSDGAELVENIRKKTAVSYRKTLTAISGVLEFLKEKVPACSEMVDGLMTAVSESQVCSPLVYSTFPSVTL